jgi:hypothetical protein
VQSEPPIGAAAYTYHVDSDYIYADPPDLANCALIDAQPKMNGASPMCSYGHVALFRTLENSTCRYKMIQHFTTRHNTLQDVITR